MRYTLEKICTSLVRGPFGSALKKEFFVEPSKDTYKVYEQGNAIRKSQDYGQYYITSEKYNELKRFEVKPYDFIMSCSGTIGELYQLPEDAERGVINQALLKITLNNQLVDYDYFAYIFKYNVSNLEAKGSGIQNVASIKVLKEMEFEIPDMQSQKNIVEILNKSANVITMRTKEVTAFDDLIKARFVELFGDPKLNDKGWNSGIVLDYYNVKGGKRIPKGMGYADGVTAHPYLRATDMKNETILDDDIHYIDDEVFEHIKRYTVKGGDIYLTNVGVNLGMAGVIPDKYDGANLTENAVKLVPKTEKVIDGVFLAHYINSPGIQEYINERKMSVGVPKLAIFRIETMPLLLPPMEVQIQFIEFVKQVDKSKVVVQKALEETQLLFDSLMQEYFG